MISLYILSAISGNLLSALISDSLSVGASTAIFGILACLLGYLVVNWDALERYGTMRCMVLCMIIIMIMLNVLVGLGNKSTIDNYGHLGGFIIGINLSFILVVPIQPN
jgi:rhomboid protease GluP